MPTAEKKRAPKPAKVQVVNAQARLRHFGDTIIKPGVNSIDADVAEAMKANPQIQKAIKQNLLAIHDAPPSTKKLAPAEAVELVEKTNDLDLLADYEAEDPRASVAKAVVDQRDSIKNPKPAQEE